MLDIVITNDPGEADVLALPVSPACAPGDIQRPGHAAGGIEATGKTAGARRGELDGAAAYAAGLPGEVVELARLFLVDADLSGAAGTTGLLPMPGRHPNRLLLLGVGDGGEQAWRSAGAALMRAAARHRCLRLQLPAELTEEAVRGLAEGLLLADYRFRLGAAKPNQPVLAEVVLATAHPTRYHRALATARVVARHTHLARDLTNMPGLDKSPQWFAEQVRAAAAGRPDLSIQVRDPQWLAEQGFGGIVAVGSGSARGPRLVELSWRPPSAATHVVLVGKGITFDSGGLCLKTADGMRLMRKDMAGAAAVVATTLAAADLGLGVRVTALTPLAENMPGGTAYRPGDVIRHYGGLTTEVTNTDAEGRVVLGDALAYAVHDLAPDYVVDLATLTGAAPVAVGKRTAALFSPSDVLAAALAEAATDAGERVWRLPIYDEYAEQFASELADQANSGGPGGGGAIIGALYLREFLGPYRDRWAHLDMSAPAWADSADGELVKGATGWGVRTLLRWLQSLAAQSGAAVDGRPANRS